MKTISPREWVDAAIACGADPRIVPGLCDRHGIPQNPQDRALQTNLDGIDSDKHPEPFPKEWGDEVCEIFASMGRDHRKAVRP